MKNQFEVVTASFRLNHLQWQPVWDSHNQFQHPGRTGLSQFESVTASFNNQEEPVHNQFETNCSCVNQFEPVSTPSQTQFEPVTASFNNQEEVVAASHSMFEPVWASHSQFQQKKNLFTTSLYHILLCKQV